MTEPRTHHAGNQRPNKSRQCTAHVAKRAERHDSAVEGEHERDQWSRNEIRAEFAGQLLYPPTCQRLSSGPPMARPRRLRHVSRSIAQDSTVGTGLPHGGSSIRPISAVGHKQTPAVTYAKSASPLKADIRQLSPTVGWICEPSAVQWLSRLRPFADPYAACRMSSQMSGEHRFGRDIRDI